MRHAIKSRKLGKKLVFFWDEMTGGYIYLEELARGKTGTLGYQICNRGRLVGSTLLADTPEQFLKIVKNWYRRSLQP